MANASCPPFLTASVGTYSNTFYANIGDPNGPAKIVMAESAPTRCSGCKFSSAIFTVTEYPATASTCPTTLTSTATCSWSASGKMLVDIPSVVNGDIAGSIPIFTYNTLDPVSGTYVPNNGGTAGANGILPGFTSACSPPSSTSQNCLPDTIQSVGIDIQVQTAGSPVHENSFTVYRLSSASYLYSPIVG